VPSLTAPPDILTGKLFGNFVIAFIPIAANEQKQELKPEFQDESLVDDNDKYLWKKIEKITKNHPQQAYIAIKAGANK
jgi:hypothetical protein